VASGPEVARDLDSSPARALRVVLKKQDPETTLFFLGASREPFSAARVLSEPPVPIPSAGDKLAEAAAVVSTPRLTCGESCH
jgi:hypothetical protein